MFLMMLYDNVALKSNTENIIDSSIFRNTYVRLTVMNYDPTL